MELTDVQRRFVVHWGEMGTRWGINRTVAQIHALLYLSPQPLPADEITETLGVARSNVSNSLKELQGWGLVRVTGRLGDRRDHFKTHEDVWEMFEIILEERKKREIDPTMQILRELVRDSEANDADTEYTRQQLFNMFDFFDTMTRWYGHVKRMPTRMTQRLARMGDKLKDLVVGGSNR